MNNFNQVDQLLWKIIEIGAGLRPDGEGRIRLPAERQLAEMLDVPRPSLRERLAVLETMGLIDRTQGRGTYLTFPRPVFLQVYFDIAWNLGFISMEELQRTQHMLVREIASVAAGQRVSEDVRAMEQALAQLRKANSHEEQLEAHHEFHRLLAMASRNPVIQLLIEGLSLVLRRVMQHHLHLIQMIPGAFDRNILAHENILDAVKKGDPELATIAVDEYFHGIARERGKVSMLYNTE